MPSHHPSAAHAPPRERFTVEVEFAQHNHAPQRFSSSLEAAPDYALAIAELSLCLSARDAGIHISEYHITLRQLPAA